MSNDRKAEFVHLDLFVSRVYQNSPDDLRKSVEMLLGDKNLSVCGTINSIDLGVKKYIVASELYDSLNIIPEETQDGNDNDKPLARLGQKALRAFITCSARVLNLLGK